MERVLIVNRKDNVSFLCEEKFLDIDKSLFHINNETYIILKKDKALYVIKYNDFIKYNKTLSRFCYWLKHKFMFDTKQKKTFLNFMLFFITYKIDDLQSEMLKTMEYINWLYNINENIDNKIPITLKSYNTSYRYVVSILIKNIEHILYANKKVLL